MTKFIATGRCFVSSNIEMIWGIKEKPIMGGLNEESNVIVNSARESFRKMNSSLKEKNIPKSAPCLTYIIGILQACRDVYTDDYIVDHLKKAGILK
jgi:hypothetical protein